MKILVYNTLKNYLYKAVEIFAEHGVDFGIWSERTQTKTYPAKKSKRTLSGSQNVPS